MKLLLALLLAICVSNGQALTGCSVCKEVIQTVAGLLDEEESTIVAAVDKLCSDLGPLETVCDNVVNSFLPNIIKWLENHETEDEICQKMGLCSTRDAEPRLNLCPVCTTIVHIVDSLLGQDIPEIEAKVNSLCEELPGNMGDQCKLVLDADLQNVINFLNEGDTPEEICGKLKLCRSEIKAGKMPVQKAVKLIPAKPKSLECSVCTVFVRIIDSLLGEEIPVIEAKVNGLCETLDDQLAEDCKKIVDRELESVIAYLNQGDTIKEICVKIGLCSSTVTEVKQQNTPKSWECDLCTIGVTEVLKYINESEATIQGKLDSLCEDLRPVAGTCKQLVDEYLPSIIDYLDNGNTVQEVCQEIDLCATIAKRLTVIQKPIQTAVKLVAATPKSFECSVCTTLVHIVDNLLGADISSIQSEINKMCDALGDPLAKDCKTIVDRELENVITYLNQSATPKEICVKIGLCSPTVTKVEQKETPKSWGCELCTVGVTEVLKYINESESTIQGKLDSLCENLEPVAGTCKQLVDEYLPSIIDYLENGNTVQEVCQEVDLCATMTKRLARSVPSKVMPAIEKIIMPKSNKMVMPAWRPKHLLPLVRGASCTVCEVLLKVTSGLLGYEDTVIEKKLDDFCSNLSGLANACTAIVNKELQAILTELRNGEDQKKICQKLKLCPQKMSY